ncbi:MAG: hypothetical protein JJU20_04215 [Opitutales bacterium]|nr:hypothetical protein [Opitutales bacterium]
MELIIGLILIAFVLFFLEIFMPGGLLAIVGGLLLLAASWLTFDAYGILPAAVMLFATAVLGVVMFFVEVRLLTRSPLGKQFRLDNQITASVNPREDDSLVGMSGVTLTTLAPSGKVQIQQKVYPASAQEGYLEKGTPISVVRSETFKLIVAKK